AELSGLAVVPVSAIAIGVPGQADALVGHELDAEPERRIVTAVVGGSDGSKVCPDAPEQLVQELHAQEHIGPWDVQPGQLVAVSHVTRVAQSLGRGSEQ